MRGDLKMSGSFTKTKTPFFSLAIESRRLPAEPTPLVVDNNQGYFRISNKNQSMRVSLRQRDAYPGTYCDQVDGHHVVLGYGDQNQRPEHEFLAIKVSDKGDISIKRDVFVTLPLYYGLSEGTLVAGNSYAEVVAALPRVTLSHSRLLEVLALRHLHRPLTHEIEVLYEGEELRFYGGKLQIIRPPDRAWAVSGDVPETDPKQFGRTLNDYFEFFIGTRLKGQKCVFEFSGGMDSTTLPQYYALTRGKAPLCAVMLFEGKHRVTQRQKIDSFRHATGARVITVDADHRRYPLSSMMEHGSFEPFHVRKIYHEIFEPYNEKLRSVGTEILVTGIGGDEMLCHTVDPEQVIAHGDIEEARRQAVDLPMFLTDAFKDAYIAATPKEPHRSVPLRIHSVADSQAGNSDAIDRGWWPVTPFGDPWLLDWCQGLPVHFRANKNILRAYHEAHGFVEEIYNPTVNEDFRGLLAKSMRLGVYDKLVQRLADESIAAKLGYVKIDKLLDIYERAKRDDYPDEGNELFSFYKWLTTELNAQHTGFVGIS